MSNYPPGVSDRDMSGNRLVNIGGFIFNPLHAVIEQFAGGTHIFMQHYNGGEDSEGCRRTFREKEYMYVDILEALKSSVAGGADWIITVPHAPKMEKVDVLPEIPLPWPKLTAGDVSKMSESELVNWNRLAFLSAELHLDMRGAIDAILDCSNAGHYYPNGKSGVYAYIVDAEAGLVVCRSEFNSYQVAIYRSVDPEDLDFNGQPKLNFLDKMPTEILYRSAMHDETMEEYGDSHPWDGMCKHSDWWQDLIGDCRNEWQHRRQEENRMREKEERDVRTGRLMSNLLPMSRQDSIAFARAVRDEDIDRVTAK